MYITKWAHTNNVKLISYVDDLHNNKNKNRNMIISRLINSRSEVLFGSYMYIYEQYHNIKNNIIWLPHCFYDKYNIEFNNNPILKILLSGVICNKIYPMRRKLFNLIKKYPIVYQEYAGYNEPKHNTCGKKYIELLNKYFVSFTCCSTLNTPYLISKFFEIPGSGSLLLAYDKHIKVQMRQLGFIDMVNYISVDDNNLREKIQFVLNNKNYNEINRIRKNGYDFVRNSHMLSHRATTINDVADNILYKDNIKQTKKMKILVLTTFPLSKLDLELKHCKRQYHIITYMINKYLNPKSNIELILYECTQQGTSTRYNYLVERENFPLADHAILVDNRGFISRTDKFYELLRPKIKGALCTFSASNVFTGKEDILYYMIPSGKPNKRKCKLINWCCTHELCTPKQDKNKLRILIDHNYYGPHVNMIKADITEKITEQVCEFAKTYTDKEIVVRRFIKGGVETVDINNISKLEKYKQGTGLSYEQACEEYSYADIFIVTHKECMGLSVLESAMAGALVVTPDGYIKSELIHKIHHISYDGEQLPWTDIIQNLDIDKSRNNVIDFNWENAIEKIYETLYNYDEYLQKDMRFRNIH